MAAHEQDPKNSSLGQTAIWFSNAAQTEFEQVSPDNALPVTIAGSTGNTAVTVADGADVALGAKADAAVTNPASSASVIALLKGWLTGLGAVADAAWTSGSGSVIALLKAIAGAAVSTDPVQTFASNNYTNITTQTTTLVKSGAGTLMTLSVGTPTALGVITIYDSLTGSGTKIGTLTQGATATAPFSLQLNAAFSTGLTIVTATATQDVTVTSR